MSLQINTLAGEIKKDAFGYSVALGDVNGDGKNEIIVASTNGRRGGTVSIFSSKSYKLLKRFSIGKKKINTIRLLTKDINNDNVNEIIIAVTYQDLSGEVKVYSLTQNKILYHWKHVEKYDTFGFSVATGDIDGDGIQDIIVGAPQPVKDGKGKVYVYSGKDGSLIKEFSSRIPREHSDFGTSVAAGDVDNDGIDEVIIGAPGLPYGEVFIYSGIHGWLIYKLQGDPGFGIMVHTDDIDGDGQNEIIVTTKKFEGNKVSVYGTHFMHLYDIENDEVDIGFGETITTGDFNGDGVKELILGAFDSDHNSKKYAGQINIYNGENGELIHRWYGSRENDQFGFSVAAGKLNTPKDAILIGAPREILQRKGMVYIVYDE